MFFDGGTAIFIFHVWIGLGLNDGALIDFPETKKKLGLPKGSYKQLPKMGKMVFTRQFEHAEVWVNLNTFEAEIKWSDGSKTSNRKPAK